MTKPLLIKASGGGNADNSLHIKAEGKPQRDLANVSGVAYSGGPMSIAWSGPVIAEIDGMEIAPQLPLLLAHWNDPSARLGVVTATKADNQLHIAGGIDTSDEKGRRIVEAGRKYEWQLSIGADVVSSKFVPEDETRTINGREFAGPFHHVIKSILREVSVVAVGADMATHMRIAASFNPSNPSNLSFSPNNPNPPPQNKKESQMDKTLLEFIRAKYSLGKDWDESAVKAHLGTVNSSVEAEQAEMLKAAKPEAAPQAAPRIEAGLTPAAIEGTVNESVQKALQSAREAETARIAAINTIAKDYPNIQAKAIAAGWSKEQAEHAVEVIKAYAANLPGATGNIIVRTGPEINAAALEASLCLQAGIKQDTIKASCGEQAMDIADKHLRGMALKDVMVEACRLEGKNTGIAFNNDTIRAAFSTVSLPGILSNVANKKAMQAYTAVDSIASRICSTGDLNDFKESDRVRLVDVGDLEKVAADGELKHGSLGEDRAKNKLDTYGKMFSLTRQMMYDDDLGEFLKIPTAFGNRAKRKIDQVFFTRLLANPTQADNERLFSAAHKNYTGGAAGALAVESLEKAISKFMDQVDSDGQPIAVSPKFLLVPTALYPTAQRLTMSTLLIGGSEVAPAANIIANYNLEPVASPYLSNAGYPGSSSTGWYLFADPAQVDTFEIGYFRGKDTPTVEFASANFNVLGMDFRVFFDFGIREQDHRGMTFNKGAN